MAGAPCPSSVVGVTLLLLLVALLQALQGSEVGHDRRGDKNAKRLWKYKQGDSCSDLALQLPITNKKVYTRSVTLSRGERRQAGSGTSNTQHKQNPAARLSDLCDLPPKIYNTRRVSTILRHCFIGEAGRSIRSSEIYVTL